LDKRDLFFAISRDTGWVRGEHFRRFPRSANERSTPSEPAVLNATAVFHRRKTVDMPHATSEGHARHLLAYRALEKHRKKAHGFEYWLRIERLDRHRNGQNTEGDLSEVQTTAEKLMLA
jgi:hypothetical protein